MRPRRIIINILTVLATIAVMLVVLEVGFRLFKPQRSMAVTVNVWDRVTGTKQRPGSRGYLKTPEYEMDLVINSKGLRDREIPYSKPDGITRILVLGGSFTCGYGVAAEETYPKVLERLLNSDDTDAKRWEVLNGGVGSTGTAHQLAYFNHEGYKYSPDFVILSFSHTTDFWDSYVSGLYSLEDGKLVKHDAPATTSRRIQAITAWIPWYNTLSTKSHLLNFVKRRASRHHYRDLAVRSGFDEKDAERKEKEAELTRHLLLALRDSCERRGCRLIFMAAPAVDTFDWRPRGRDLIAFAQAQGITFVDLRDAFRTAAEAGVQLSYRVDHHWTKAGHEVVAQALHEFFANEM